MDSLLVENNVVIQHTGARDSRLWIGQFQHIVHTSGANTNTQFLNNVAVGHFGSIGIGANAATSPIIANNTMVPADSDSGFVYVIGATTTDAICVNNVARRIEDNGADTVETGDYDYGYDAISTVGFTSWSASMSPLDYDLTPTPASPLYDTGAEANAPAYDILGTSRPQGAGYDIGAYENDGG